MSLEKFSPSSLFFACSDWKYLVNLAGSEMPLYSVDELSDRLRKSNVQIATDSYHWDKYNERQKHSYKRVW